MCHQAGLQAPQEATAVMEHLPGAIIHHLAGPIQVLPGAVIHHLAGLIQVLPEAAVLLPIAVHQEATVLHHKAVHQEAVAAHPIPVLPGAAEDLPIVDPRAEAVVAAHTAAVLQEAVVAVVHQEAAVLLPGPGKGFHS